MALSCGCNRSAAHRRPSQATTQCLQPPAAAPGSQANYCCRCHCAKSLALCRNARIRTSEPASSYSKRYLNTKTSRTDGLLSSGTIRPRSESVSSPCAAESACSRTASAPEGDSAEMYPNASSSADLALTVQTTQRLRSAISSVAPEQPHHATKSGHAQRRPYPAQWIA